MENCKHDQLFVAHSKIDNKRESSRANAPHFGYNLRVTIRRAAGTKQCTIDLMLEIGAKAKSLLFVPAPRRGIFTKCLAPK